MNDALRVNVITSCTGRKVALAPGDTVPAERLYCGQQHVRLMRGVDYLRGAGATVDVWIVSAGHGLVHGTERLASYERTFQGRRTTELNAMASQLGIPRAIKAVLACRASLTVVLLGADYLHACQLDGPLEQGAPTLVFASASTSLAMSGSPGLHVVSLGVEHTRQFAAGLVSLKGEVGGRLLAALADGAVSITDVLAENPLPVLAAFSAQSETADSSATLF
jgi:hypothetical protein